MAWRMRACTLSLSAKVQADCDEVKVTTPQRHRAHAA
jgi:hypothetical protein